MGFETTWIAVILVSVNIRLCQTTTGYTCCSSYLMDSSGTVAIETKRSLVAGDYLALLVRTCTSDPVVIQIWRRTTPQDNTTFAFRWQTVVVQTASKPSNTYSQVIFDSVLSITSEDRLGIFSPTSSSASGGASVPIPFGVDTSSNFLYHSINRFSSFVAIHNGTTLSMDQQRWPRSFDQTVLFCMRSDCSDVPANFPTDTPAQTTTTSTPTTSPSNFCCQNQVSCDSSSLTDPLAKQNTNIEQLQIQIYQLNQLIERLSSFTPNGICPQGFTVGPYGLGTCYVLYRDAVDMAVAALRCIDLDAALVQVDSMMADAFLRTFVGGTGQGSQNYWTSGMYFFTDQRWWWYDEYAGTRSRMNYNNWRQGSIPKATTPGVDVCSTFHVDDQPQNQTSYLQMTDCRTKNYYICETPKICY